MNVSIVIQNTKMDKQVNAYLFVCLSAILVGLTVILIGIHEQAHRDYKPNDSVQWRESFDANVESSQMLNTQVRRPIGNAVWDFQYSPIIQILWRAPLNSDNELVANSETLALLKRASAVLPQTISSEEFQRLDFVIRKSMPSSAGTELANLLKRYYFYEQENMAALQLINSVDNKQKRALLVSAKQSSEERQVRFFGENIAMELFSENNKTQNYLNARRMINLSETLSAKEIKERLDQLQNAYRRSLQD